MQRLVVTGGAGFIGSALIRFLLQETDCEVINVDKLTYAGNLRTLETVLPSDRHTFEQVDICDADAISRVFKQYRPTGIIHLAAESHVDRSIADPDAFIRTNVMGTHVLLEQARRYWLNLDGSAKRDFRFHHVSTDEVFGDLNFDDPPFTEATPYAPSSPYSASKASSDHLVRAWYRTYGFPVVISNCSNNYGPYQYPEKLIPVIIHNALEGNALPVYGEGQNIRDWLYVEDHVRAIMTIFDKGVLGETYVVGGNNEVKNIELVTTICTVLDEKCPRSTPHADLIEFVRDRPGHDLRYAIDSAKLQAELNWRPLHTVNDGLVKTIEWYLENRTWFEIGDKA